MPMPFGYNRPQPILQQGIPWLSQADADAFIPPPGLPTLIFVQGTNRFVSKSLDGLQRVVTEVFEYKEVKPVPPQNPEFITKADLSEFASGLHQELAPLLALLNQNQPQNAQRIPPASGKKEEPANV